MAERPLCGTNRPGGRSSRVLVLDAFPVGGTACLESALIEAADRVNIV
ncbi:MAG TPA: hypothetical protein VKZ50_05980 [bacterium]|nr:hypothetical protein [bacterium]